MNIAFPAFLLFLFLIPGFILRASARTLEGTRVDAGPFASSSLRSVLYSLALNLIGWWIVEQFTIFTVHWDALLGLFGEKSEDRSRAIALIDQHPLPHVAYFLCMYLSAATLGGGVRALTLRFKLDKKGGFLAPLLRLGNEWFYLFKGYDEPTEPDLIYVTTVVNFDEPVLYRGVVRQFHLGGDGSLDRIVLTGASRRKLASDKNAPGANPSFYPIEGDFFILRYSEIVTLNVFYLYAQFHSASVTEKAAASDAVTADVSG